MYKVTIKTPYLFDALDTFCKQYDVFCENRRNHHTCPLALGHTVGSCLKTDLGKSIQCDGNDDEFQELKNRIMDLTGIEEVSE